MNSDDVGVMVGIALIAVGAWVGKVYGAKAERKFDRTVTRVLFGSAALFLVLVLILWGIAGRGGGSETTRGCKRLAETAEKFSPFLTRNDFDGGEFQRDFAVFGFLTAVPDAPVEIRDDLEVLDDAYSKYGHALATIDPAKVDQNLQKNLTAKINKRKVMRASQNIVAWARKKCA